MSMPPADVIEIQQLISRYCHAVDHGTGEQLAATFIQDGMLVIQEPVQGREAIARGVQWREGLRQPRHIVSTTTIEGDGDSATAFSYVHVLVTDENSKPQYLTSGTYSDRLVKVAGRWLFAEKVYQAFE